MSRKRRTAKTFLRDAAKNPCVWCERPSEFIYMYMPSEETLRQLGLFHDGQNTGIQFPLCRHCISCQRTRAALQEQFKREYHMCAEMGGITHTFLKDKPNMVRIEDIDFDKPKR